MAFNRLSAEDSIAVGFATFAENPLLDNLDVGKREKTMMEAYALFMTGAFLASYPDYDFAQAYSAVREGMIHGACMTHTELAELRRRLTDGNGALAG